MSVQTVTFSLNPTVYGGYTSGGGHVSSSSAVVDTEYNISDTYQPIIEYNTVKYFVFDPHQLTIEQQTALDQGTATVYVNFTTSTAGDYVPHTINVVSNEVTDNYQDLYTKGLDDVQGTNTLQPAQLLVDGVADSTYEGNTGTYIITHALSHITYPGVSVAEGGSNDNAQQTYNITAALTSAYKDGRDLIFAFFENSGGVSNVTNVSITGGGTATSYVDIVSSGQTVNSAVYAAPSVQNVQSGGRTSGTVLNGGFETVSSGGFAGGTVASSGGQLTVLSGGVASGGYIYAAGQIAINNGGTATAFGIGPGGLGQVGIGGVVASAVVSSGGKLGNYGGFAISDTVLAGGQMSVSGVVTTDANGIVTVSSGVASATAIKGGGNLDVLNLGVASGTVLSANASEVVYSGGTTLGTLVGSGAYEFVYGGGVASGAEIQSGGALYLQSGGTTRSVTLDALGLEIVSSGGVASNTTVGVGATLQVLSGGVASGVVAVSGAIVRAFGAVQLTSGNVASGVDVQSGGILTVGAGATAVVGLVESGGVATVSSGGVAASAQVAGGGALNVYGSATAIYVSGQGATDTVLSGGIASSTALFAGGTETVASGGVSTSASVRLLGSLLVTGSGVSATVIAGGQATVSSGGVASATTVSSGGVLTVLSGGTDAGASIRGGAQLVSAGGTTSAATVSSGGTQYLNGGLASATTVLSGGIETVSSGGRAVGTTVSSGGRMVVSSGATADMFTISGGATLRVEAVSPGTGTVSGGTVEVAGVAGPTSLQFYGGNEILLAGATLSNARVTAAGLSTLSVSSGATASGTSVSSGGTLTVFSGGVTSGGRIALGGTQVVSSGGVAYNPLLSAGGTLVDNGSVVFGSTTSALGSLSGSGAVTVSGGTLLLSGTNTFAGAVSVVSGARLAVSGADAAGTGTIRLTSGATLDIRGSAMPTAQITGSTGGSIIDIEALAYSPGSTATVSHGVLTVTAAGSTDTLAVPDVADGTLFSTSQDTNGGTQIQQVVCYCRGTLIRTERGETPVERLTPGTRVLTRSGTLQPVLWVGTRSFGRAHIAHGLFLPPTAWPVRIAAGAFGPHMPHTDLRVSPGHALCHDGVLIPAFALVNGTTIRAEPVAEIDYFHIELPAHDVVLANGLASESWLDTGNRPFFDNAPVTALHRPASDAFLLGGSGHCLPWHADGPAVTAARQATHTHAVALGWTYTQDPDLHLLADGLRVDPFWQDGDVLCFTIPPGSSDLRLASRAFRLTDRAPDAADVRRLGLAISALRLDGAAVDLVDLEGQPGWWSIESGADRSWRWTDGAALLPAGTRKAMVSIAQRGTYLVAPDAGAADRQPASLPHQ